MLLRPGERPVKFPLTHLEFSRDGYVYLGIYVPPTRNINDHHYKISFRYSLDLLFEGEGRMRLSPSELVGKPLIFISVPRAREIIENRLKGKILFSRIFFVPASRVSWGFEAAQPLVGGIEIFPKEGTKFEGKVRLVQFWVGIEISFEGRGSLYNPPRPVDDEMRTKMGAYLKVDEIEREIRQCVYEIFNDEEIRSWAEENAKSKIPGFKIKEIRNLTLEETDERVDTALVLGRPEILLFRLDLSEKTKEVLKDICDKGKVDNLIHFLVSLLTLDPTIGVTVVEGPWRWKEFYGGGDISSERDLLYRFLLDWTALLM